MEKVKIALIGAGRTGTPLLRELFKYPFVEVVGVADLNPQAEGVKLASEKVVYTTSDPMELVKKGEEIDVLIEVSGDKSLKKQIKSYFEEVDNKKTIIMHDLIARLFITVCTGEQSLVPSFHPDDIGIGD